MQIIGCDFSSRPTRRKPVVIACGALLNKRVQLLKLERLESLDAFESWLTTNNEWIGGFDLPFGLPRELVEQLGWPLQWRACIEHYTALPREHIRSLFKAFCDARPAGRKFAHRAADAPAGSSPSMKWVNPPVAYMLHAGVPCLLRAGAHLPGLCDGNLSKVALEAYPGLLARELIGSRSYKSDDKLKQTPDRLIARKDIITALENVQTRLGVQLKLSHAQRDVLIHDASGDSLDAVLCMLQAAWALMQHERGVPRYGLPVFDALEGWIVTA
jgi:hypothetical protein